MRILRNDMIGYAGSEKVASEDREMTGLPASNPGFSCYNLPMQQKPLIETNPHLRDPEKFRKALITNVSSSTSVETGASVESIARALIEGSQPHTVKKPQGSAR
jgi:hypothetical protein